MNIVRQIQRSGLALAFGGLLAISAQAQEVVLKLHHIWPTVAMGHTRVAVPWCEDIAKESNNRMRCQLLPAMSGGGTHQGTPSFISTRQPQPAKWAWW